MMERSLQLSDLAALEKYTQHFGRHGDDYIICKTNWLLDDICITDPVLFTGTCFCVLQEGEITCEIEFKQFKVTAPALISFGGKRVFRNTGLNNAKLDCLFLSSQFVHDLSIDLSAVNLHDMIENPPRPVIDGLTPNEVKTFGDYFGILYRNAVDGNEIAFSKNIARSTVQALFYQLMQFYHTHSSRTAVAKDEGSLTRQISYVQEFMRLLQLHHKIHRSITFYAERMYISPKYLSHIIKEATGKSATEWIAEFVVMEAKNMLRYSHKNIQQVAYELNFTTQSSFGKYFKHVTGMSPTEFQKS